jgi:hypothetical protein
MAESLADISEHIQSLIDYVKDEELEYALQNGILGHMLQRIVAVQNWLDGTNLSVVEYLKQGNPDFDPNDYPNGWFETEF